MPTDKVNITLTVEGTDNLKPIIAHIASRMANFYQYMSRDKMKIVPRSGPIGSGGHLTATNKILRLIPGRQSSLPVIGNGISAKHELGHEFLLGHSSTRVWTTQTKLGFYKHEQDPFDPMTTSPGVNSINAAHLHVKGWFANTEEAYAEDNGEYDLHILNDMNTNDRTSLKALYYEVPNSTTRKYWFSCVLLGGKTPGLAIAVHTIQPRGTSQVNIETYLEQIYMVKDSGTTNIRTGLILELSNPTKNSLHVKVKIDPTWVLTESMAVQTIESAMDGIQDTVSEVNVLDVEVAHDDSE
jgi:hypothetical protein